MKDLLKKILEPKIVRRITGTICALQGLFSVFLAVMVLRLYLSSPVSELGINEAELIPLVAVFCAGYGIVSLVYAYLRFFFAAENKFVKICWKYKITFILYIILSGMSLVWVIPTLTASTDLRGFIEIPAGIAGALAILLDAYLYIRVFIRWLKG